MGYPCSMQNLKTIRDMLRYAVTSFNKAGLAYGHGASNAIDEAAFIILESLKLPVSDINPWADARLTAAELDDLLALIKAPMLCSRKLLFLGSLELRHEKAGACGPGLFICSRLPTPCQCD